MNGVLDNFIHKEWLPWNTNCYATGIQLYTQSYLGHPSYTTGIQLIHKEWLGTPLSMPLVFSYIHKEQLNWDIPQYATGIQLYTKSDLGYPSIRHWYSAIYTELLQGHPSLRHWYSAIHKEWLGTALNTPLVYSYTQRVTWDSNLYATGIQLYTKSDFGHQSLRYWYLVVHKSDWTTLDIRHWYLVMHTPHYATGIHLYMPLVFSHTQRVTWDTPHYATGIKSYTKSDLGHPLLRHWYWFIHPTGI